jgi:hypothetical protein
MRYWLFIAAAGMFALAGCATAQIAAYPQGQAIVCAAKAGKRLSYWNTQAADQDGAVVILAGECPAEPNTEGRSGSGM